MSKFILHVATIIGSFTSTQTTNALQCCVMARCMVSKQCYILLHWYEAEKSNWSHIVENRVWFKNCRLCWHSIPGGTLLPKWTVHRADKVDWPGKRPGASLSSSSQSSLDRSPSLFREECGEQKADVHITIAHTINVQRLEDTIVWC